MRNRRKYYRNRRRNSSSFVITFLTIVLVLVCVTIFILSDNGVFTPLISSSSISTAHSSAETPTSDNTNHSIVIDNTTKTTVAPTTETTTEPTSPEETAAEKPTATEPSTTPPERTTTPPETSTIPSETTTLPPETSVTPPGGAYDYSKPVPKSAPVDDNYFLDALFLGDSLTDGLSLYSGLKTATFYSKQALSTSTAFTKKVITIGDQTLSVIDAMRITDFNKVYIMFGINEVGYPSTSSFEKKYGQIIDAVREVNPDAIIYVQSILPITAKTSETHKYIKNTSIIKFNKALKELATEKQVYFLNVAEALSDESGALLSDASSDGIHLKKAYYKVWLEYLKNHIVS